MSEFIDNISSVRNAAAEDFRSSSPTQALGFIATSAALVAHESVMMEALFAIGSHAFEYSHNPLVVASAMGGFSLAVESGLSLGIAHSIQTFGRATQKIKDNYFNDTIEEPKPKGNKILNGLDNALFAASLGSPGVVLREFSRNPDKTLEDNKRTGFRAARALSAVNVVLGLTLASGVAASEQLGTDVVSDTVINLGNNPSFYASTFSIVGARALFAGRKHRKQKQAAANDSQEPPVID